MLKSCEGKDCRVIRSTIWQKGQWQLVLESEWSPNRDTVIPYGITVKTRFGTKPHSRGDDLKDVECFKCHKKGHYANKCPEIKVKDGKPPVKVRKMEDSGPKSDPEAKSVRQIRIRYSDIEEQNSDPFMRHWILLKKSRADQIGVGF